eukprot:COSAG01_NODE_9237_length_2510_cov_7.014102_1_plen_187_part_10
MKHHVVNRLQICGEDLLLAENLLGNVIIFFPEVVNDTAGCLTGSALLAVFGSFRSEPRQLIAMNLDLYRLCGMSRRRSDSKNDKDSNDDRASDGDGVGKVQTVHLARHTSHVTPKYPLLLPPARAFLAFSSLHQSGWTQSSFRPSWSASSNEECPSLRGVVPPADAAPSSCRAAGDACETRRTAAAA